MSDPKKVTFDLIAFLRRRHPIKTAEAVADLTGAPANTVRQWLKGVSRPGFAHTLALIAAYGPDFLSAALPGFGWLDEAVRADRIEALMARSEQLKRDWEGWKHEMAASAERRGAHRAGDVGGRGDAVRLCGLRGRPSLHGAGRLAACEGADNCGGAA